MVTEPENADDGTLTLDLPFLVDDKAVNDALGLTGVSAAVARQRREKLARLAVREWVDWLNGKWRPDTVPALERARILKIFAIIRKDTPAVDKLVEGFGIPEGRAMSMVSRMKYGAARWIRGTDLQTLAEDLATTITRARDELAKAKKELEQDKEFPIPLNRPQSELLYAMLVSLDNSPDVEDRKVGRHTPTLDRYGATWRLNPPQWAHVIKRLGDESKDELAKAASAGVFDE